MRIACSPLLCIFLFTGCEGCFSPDLSVTGARPHTRCLAAKPGPDRSLDIGPVRAELKGRRLTLTGLSSPTLLAVFSGPGLGAPPNESQLAPLKQGAIGLALVLGDAGDSPESAMATLASLSATGVPVLFLAGGRDRGDGLVQAGLGSLPGIIDITPLTEIRINKDTFVPVAGAERGRYALGPRACGFELDDLKRIAGELGEPSEGERRWLLSWEAPAGWGLTRTARGHQLGSADLAELARRLDAPGGLSARPHLQLMRPMDAAGPLPAGVASRSFRLVVPRLSGPVMERDDGSRVLPALALLELGPGGLREAPRPEKSADVSPDISE